MSEYPAPPAASSILPPNAPAKSSGRAFLEDLLVSGFGMASSAAVAYGSHYTATNWEFAPFTWMADMIIPVGAILCGIVAAIGYWVGARTFNHRPTRWLMVNILFVSLSTFFWIHYLDYSAMKVNGVPVEHLMPFEKYLTLVTEHMHYKDSHSTGEGVELGKWGWGVAALQVIGFSLGGLVVYSMLKSVPYCSRCAKYLSEKKTRVAQWKEVGLMQQGYAELANLIQAGNLQQAIDRHGELGEKRRFNIHGMLRLELRKCPGCENRRLRLTGQSRRGNRWLTAGQLDTPTEQPIQMA
jgi:hypothetical protein